ncbi:dephospho-CoA kinase [Paenibacillus shirakamiensis]|uniref:Dephospho-CoA kinase n=1 Tax=Paenibacillus shirakamiensis TaxID=1265935 RepID=A0ABS4JLE7_9BACL|nr:dephospho-CoA kinase [Paenibacillus shirakamiensis]MBP2002518.1 dephospho-CoA kinase [Paenibacillus shirakamiensis]
MNIGLTGGIASGKSTVSQLFVQQGALLIDADAVAREVMQPGHPVLAEVAKRFGSVMIREDGTLDRAKLGSLIFNHPDERKALEAITHPAIRAEMRSRAAAYDAAQPGKLVISDIPLLYETGQGNDFYEVLVVYVPADIQRTRLMARNGLTKEEAEARLASQWDIERKRELADVVIDNRGTLAETERQIHQYMADRGLS